MTYDEAFRSPETLLRHAAAADAAYAVALLERVSTTRLLDLVVTQAELATDEDRPRAAGIDAVGDLARAAIEIMDLPQGTDLDLDEDDPETPPTVTGWELATVDPDELPAATLALPVSPWLLALVAFWDETETEAGVVLRHVVAAAADGRVASARLRLSDPGADALDDPDVLAATVSRDPEDLGRDAPLATALFAALCSAARGS